jgi:hypothetical protein
MDHAGWVAANLPHYKKAVGAQKPRKDAFGSVKGWHGAPDVLTPFHCRIFDILGMTFGGIYNAPISWDAVQWNGWGREAIAVPVRSDLATWDGMALTRLVFLCHEARIRCEVRPNGPHHLLLAFWQRAAEGCTATRHPDLDEAVAMFRNYLPSDHATVYGGSGAAAEAA